MPNHYFQFKQFTVHQEKCAMKVCTDACLFGAWLAAEAALRRLQVAKCLDIGAGTGLLALMLAQKNPDLLIDAVEIDDTAARQAKENFEASPWKDRLSIHHASVQDFEKSRRDHFDLIISNPPFFEHDLKSADYKRNLALHSSELRLEELAAIAAGVLKDDGLFAVLLPYHRGDSFIKTAAAIGLFLQQRIDVRQSVRHSYFRTILLFGKVNTDCLMQEITIMDANGQYTAPFVMLLKDYYLKL